MRRIVGTSLALSAALVCGGVFVAQAATSQPTRSPRTHTIAVIEHAVTDTTADTGPKGDSLGDVLAFANPIFDSTDRHRVGSDNGQCVRTAVGRAYDCQWSLRLANGSIMVQGPFYDSSDSQLTITGGTGHYIGARGQMRLHARNSAGSAYDFTYQLLG